MKKSVLLTFFFASIVLGSSLRSGLGSGETTDMSKTFYAKVKGQLQRLCILKTSDMNLIAIAWSNFNETPLFRIEYGVVSTGEGEYPEIFGKLDGYLSLGDIDVVTPYRLFMDGNHRVLNLEIPNCDDPWGIVKPRDIHHEPEDEDPECEPYEIYFLSPTEAEKRNEQNKQKQNEQKQNEQKQNEQKQNEQKQNEQNEKVVKEIEL